MEKMKSKKLFIAFVTTLTAIMIALAGWIIALAARPSTANADSNVTVTLHIYDSAQQYDKLAIWAWTKGAEGKDFYLQSNPKADEQFSKSYEDGGQTVTNTAHYTDVTFDATASEALRSGQTMGFLICVPTGKTGAKFWDKFEKETADVLTDISGVIDDKGHADLYCVRKEAVAYTKLEDAKMALEKVTSARFTGNATASGVTVAFEVTSPVTNTTQVAIYESPDATTPIQKVNAVRDSKNGFAGTAKFSQITEIDFSKDYYIKVGDIPNGASVSKTVLIDETSFINTFETAFTQTREYGAVYNAETGETTFTVWAPFASSVKIKLYDSGNGGEATRSLNMTKAYEAEGIKWSGVWTATAKNLKNKYYTYEINNNGAIVETVDPYAKACGVNGARGMVVDLDSTDPEGWENDKHLYMLGGEKAKNADTPIIWEIHVADFSASADSGMQYKGKYLAFTEKGTHLPGDNNYKTGVAYLQELGITYVHLNPVYDFQTVDEGSAATVDKTKDSFNWGYDPLNYNIPEGSYSTNPYDGNVRIKEFKQMVMALHEAGIGVIMDVVYNHTFATSGQPLHDTVPYYYHRTNADGKFTNDSGCGNGTASERTMMRKYMIDSLAYWAEEYHVDGFRFDLMGVHDKVTINLIREKLNTLNNNTGKRLLMYGEPWSADGDYQPPSYVKRKTNTAATTATLTNLSGNKDNDLVKNIWSSGNVSALDKGVAVFGNSGRDGLRGNNDVGKDGFNPGWATGNPGRAGDVKRMIEGGCGTSGSGLSTGSGSQLVGYASAHDNYPLWDQLMGKEGNKETALYYANYINDNAKKCELVAAAYLMSSGIPFMLAGEEMGRTKYGNHNSYNSPVKGNQIVWSRQIEFKNMVKVYRDLIWLRRNNGTTLFSYDKSKDPSYCHGDFTGSDDTSGYIKFTRSQGGKTLTLILDIGQASGSATIGSTKVNI